MSVKKKPVKQSSTELRKKRKRPGVINKQTKQQSQMGRPKLAAADKTRPMTIWVTDSERAKVQNAARGWLRGVIRGAKVPTKL
jgi:hypothetical protein